MFYFCGKFCGCVANSAIGTRVIRNVLINRLYLRAFQRFGSATKPPENHICNTSLSAVNQRVVSSNTDRGAKKIQRRLLCRLVNCPTAAKCAKWRMLAKPVLSLDRHRSLAYPKIVLSSTPEVTFSVSPPQVLERIGERVWLTLELKDTARMHLSGRQQ